MSEETQGGLIVFFVVFAFVFLALYFPISNANRHQTCTNFEYAHIEKISGEWYCVNVNSDSTATGQLYAILRNREKYGEEK